MRSDNLRGFNITPAACPTRYAIWGDKIFQLLIEPRGKGLAIEGQNAIILGDFRLVNPVPVKLIRFSLLLALDSTEVIQSRSSCLFTAQFFMRIPMWIYIEIYLHVETCKLKCGWIGNLFYD